MALLGWIPYGPTDAATSGANGAAQPRFVHNASGRFESRFSAVKVLPSPASNVMLKGMEGSTIGVWVSHGEGRVKFPDTAIYNRVTEEKLAPLRYVDDANEATEVYPFNPNGSVDGIAALCSPDGRHLAMMPHPCVRALRVRTAGDPQASLRRDAASDSPFRSLTPLPRSLHSAPARCSERSFLSWQLPWSPPAWEGRTTSPWMKMFQNAREFCVPSEE
jgi:phosphoribosylformylglycinamidine synthase